MSSDNKSMPPIPAKGQQSLYPSPNVIQPPTYEETMSPQGRAIGFHPASVGPISPVQSPVPGPIVQRNIP